MSKPILVLSAPVATRSGYGDMSRDIARHLIEMDKFDIHIVSMPWGSTPLNALSMDNPRDKDIIDKIVGGQLQLPRQPDIYVQITIPNEFNPMGVFNIGITAGIETNTCSLAWIEGCNRMDLILTISEHSKNVLANTIATITDKQTGSQKQEQVRKPIEILHNCVHTDIFKKIASTDIPQSIDSTLDGIKEKFCFLFVGHWLQGGMGEDRKNVGMLVQTFCETFKNVSSLSRPALILKTSGAGFSVLDRSAIIKKIQMIKEYIGPNTPNVYVLHGHLTEEEMNGLYNHPKVKAHVSFYCGEGFGRPLLEATMSEKPIIASGWSGPLDFLNPEQAVLIGGQLKPIPSSVYWENIFIPEAQWFSIDAAQATLALMTVFKQYENFLPNAKLLAEKNRNKFNYNAIFQRTKEIFTKYEAMIPVLPVLPTLLPLSLPELKKIE